MADVHNVTMDDSFESTNAQREIGPIATAVTAVQASGNIRSIRRSAAGGDTSPPAASQRAGSLRRPRYNPLALEPNPEPGMGMSQGMPSTANEDGLTTTLSNVKRQRHLPVHSLPISPNTSQSWTNVSSPQYHHIGTPEVPGFGQNGQAGPCGGQESNAMQAVKPSFPQSTASSSQYQLTSDQLADPIYNRSHPPLTPPVVSPAQSSYGPIVSNSRAVTPRSARSQHSQNTETAYVAHLENQLRENREAAIAQEEV